MLTARPPKKLVLVIEDEPSLRETLKDVLELYGYNVSEAQNGEEGLMAIRCEPAPDLVLLDLIMPLMSGRQFLMHLQADVSLQAIPVVVVSATSDTTGMLGASAVFTKPPDLDTLMNAVQHFSCAPTYNDASRPRATRPTR